MTSNDTNELRAKSRISVERKVDLVEHTPHHQAIHKSLKTSNRWVSRLRQPLTERSHSSVTLLGLVGSPSFKKRLPSLIIAGLLLFILLTILTTVPPNSVANILLYQSYLPVLIIFLFATYFLGKVIFISTRISFFTAVFFGLLLFLKFQAVELSAIVVLTPLMIFAGLEVILKLVFHK